MCSVRATRMRDSRSCAPTLLRAHDYKCIQADFTQIDGGEVSKRQSMVLCTFALGVLHFQLRFSHGIQTARITSEIFRMQQQDDKHYADLSFRLDTKVENQNVQLGPPTPQLLYVRAWTRHDLPTFVFFCPFPHDRSDTPRS